MKNRDIISHLESFAPLKFQEDYDNSGLIAGNPDEDCTGVLVSLDCTEEVVHEAIKRKVNLIITHHPLIFRPVRRISTDLDSGRALIAAIRFDITIYAAHTNLDNVISGVNGVLADKIGLINRQILNPRTNLEGVGSGMLGELRMEISETAFLSGLKKIFLTPLIRHSSLRGRPVKRVAVCGGAGSFLITNALQVKVDFFVTADLKYHEFFGAEGQLVIADIGHFESEQYTIGLLHDLILNKFPNFAVLKSETLTNPVHYYI